MTAAVDVYMAATKLVFTTDQAEGAWPNGTAVEKIHSTSSDAHKDGAKARVLGSSGPFKLKGESHYIYFVEWEDVPGVPCGIVDFRLRRVG